MIQIIFNEISAAEMAALPVDLQLELLAEFQSLPEEIGDVDVSRFGKVEREGKSLLRHRAKDYRLYFELTKLGLTIHRVLHKNTIRDFLFRAKLPMVDEEEDFEKSNDLWQLIEEGQNAKK